MCHGATGILPQALSIQLQNPFSLMTPLSGGDILQLRRSIIISPMQIVDWFQDIWPLLAGGAATVGARLVADDRIASPDLKTATRFFCRLGETLGL